LVVLDAAPDPTLDPERMAKQRALEHCLAALPPAMRAQVLMRHCFDMSFLEIAKTIGDSHGTIQVRVARILPRLRRCLSSEGITR
jgi:RNA polymerase sigma factor (sigma-70 family)